MTTRPPEIARPRATVVVYDPIDEPAAAGIQALEDLISNGAVDSNFNVLLASPADQPTQVEQWLWDWILNLPKGFDLQIAAIASFALEEESVVAFTQRVRGLTSLFTEYEMDERPHEHRYYFLNGTGLTSGKFFVETAVNLVIPAVDQISDGRKAVPIAWDADNPRKFGWHVATEAATLAGMWVAPTQDRLERVQTGTGLPAVRYARSWVRAVCVRNARPGTEDVLGAGELALASDHQRAISNARPETAVRAARHLYNAAGFDHLSEVDQPEYEAVEVGIGQALGRALAKLPGVFVAGLRGMSSDLGEELMRGLVGDATLAEFEAERAETERRLNEGQLFPESDTEVDTFPLGGNKWEQLVEEMFGVVDGGGGEAAAKARSAFGSDRKVLTNSARLTGDDVLLLSENFAEGIPDEEQLGDLLNRLASEGPQPHMPGPQGWRLGETAEGLSEEPDEATDETSGKDEVTDKTEELPVDQSEANGEAPEYQPANYLAGLSECFRVALSKKREALATSREYLRKCLEPIQEGVSSVLTRTAKAVPTLSLLIGLFILLVLSPLHESLNIEDYLSSDASNAPQMLLFLGLSIVAFWVLMLPFRPKKVGVPNYLLTLAAFGLVVFGLALVFNRNLDDLKERERYILGGIVLVVLAVLLLVTLFRSSFSTSVATDEEGASANYSPPDPDNTSNRWTGEQRAAVWGGGLYFYVLLVITMNNSFYEIQENLNSTDRRGLIIWASTIVSVGLLLLLIGMLTVAYRRVENQRLHRRQVLAWAIQNVQRQEQSLRRFEELSAVCHSAMGGWSYVVEFLSGATEQSDAQAPCEPPPLGKLRLKETAEAHSTLRSGWVSERYKEALAEYLRTAGDSGTPVSVERVLDNQPLDFSRLLRAGVYDELLGERVVQHAVNLNSGDTELLEEIKPTPEAENSTIPTGPPVGNLPATPIWRPPAREPGNDCTWHQSFRFDVSEEMRLDQLMDLQK